MKLEVLVLEPDVFEEDSYVCDFCNMTYSKEDYKVLFDSLKLIYLVVPYHLTFDDDGEKPESYSSSLNLCHSCFYTHLRTSQLKEPIEITFMQEDKEVTKFFDPNDDNDDSSFFFLPNG